jgi:hypothetical protein
LAGSWAPALNGIATVASISIAAKLFSTECFFWFVNMTKSSTGPYESRPSTIQRRQRLHPSVAGALIVIS